MNRNRVSPEMKVGILVLVAILILFYISFRVGKFGALREGGYPLVAMLQNANGLDPKSPVLLAGVEIGKVSVIKLEGYQAKATLAIKQGIRIPVDSKIVIKTQGVLGDKYVEIIPGKEATYLAKGETIKDVIPTPNFDEIFARVSSAAQSFGETMEQFRGIFGEKDKANLKKTLKNVEMVSGDFRDLLTQNKEGFTRVVSNTSEFSERLAPMADRADEALAGLRSIVSDVEKGKGTLGLLVKDDTLYRDAKETVTSLKNITADIEQGKGSLGKLAKDESVYHEAKETVKNIKEITDSIKRGEGTIGKLTKDDSLYIEAEKAMKKLQKGAEGLQEQTPITILGTILGTFF